MMNDRAPRPERALAHPLWWGALSLLLLNDHVLKSLFPGALTGKLSDFAGLVVAPWVAATLARARSKRALAICFAAVAAVFTAINVAPACARAMEGLTALLGVPWRVRCDPTDLVGLVALVPAWRTLLPATTEPTRRARLERMGLLAGSVACVATSALPPSEPATAPGTIAAQSWGGEPVYVIDPQDGARRARIDGEMSARGRWISDGVLYRVAGRTVVGHRLDDGAEVLRYTSEEASFHRVLVGDDRRLYTVAEDHDEERVVAIGKDGKVAWRAAVPEDRVQRDRSSGPLVALGQVLVPAGEHVVALAPGSGRRLWTHQAGAPVLWITASGTGVFALRDDHVLVAIEADSGERRWSLGLHEGARPSSWYGGRRLASSAESVITWDGGHLVAIDPVTRGTRWRGPRAEEAVVGDRVAFVELEDEVYGLVDLDNGSLRWKRSTIEHAILTPPVLMEQDGIVLVRPHDEVLHAYELSNGSHRWSFDLDEGEQLLTVASGRIVVTRM